MMTTRLLLLLLLIWLAFYSDRRFREIERSIPGITRRMLSRELKEMELNGLIRRLEDPDFPTKVEYEATTYCKSFADIILAMIDWGRKHRARVKQQLMA